MRPSNQQKNMNNDSNQPKAKSSAPKPVTTFFQRREVEKRLAAIYELDYGHGDKTEEIINVDAETTDNTNDHVKVDLTSESLFENLYELLVFMSEYSNHPSFKTLLLNFTKNYDCIYANNLPIDFDSLEKFHTEIVNITHQPGFFESFELDTLNNLSERMMMVEHYLDQRRSSNRP